LEHDDGGLVDRTPAASREQMMGWIAEIVEQGIRRPGYPADRWVETWAAERFTELGLADVRLEPVDTPYWEPHLAELVLLPDGPTLTGFALPHTEPGEVEAPLARFDPDAPAVDGALAVSELALSNLPQAIAKAMATAVHDPTDELATLDHTLPFGPLSTQVMQPTLETAALGYVGLLTGLGWETCDYYVPYDGVPRPIPGIWLSAADSHVVLEAMADGPVEARLHVDAERSSVTTHNVVATLPGASDEWVVIASHHDAPWSSAVEDASGVALVLAQAAHWAAVPDHERPHNLLFLLTSGHMVHAAGTRAFIEAHADLIDDIVLEVHLEHAARRCNTRGGELVPTDDPEVRWWFTSRNPELEATVAGALAAHSLERSLIFRPDVFFDMPPTDGAFFHPAGVPLVHFLTAPMYLFDSQDTLDKIHEPSLEPLTAAAADIVASTAGVSAAGMRAGVIASRPAGSSS
jgi:hypothetical protein